MKMIHDLNDIVIVSYKICRPFKHRHVLQFLNQIIIKPILNTRKKRVEFRYIKILLHCIQTHQCTRYFYIDLIVSDCYPFIRVFITDVYIYHFICQDRHLCFCPSSKCKVEPKMPIIDSIIIIFLHFYEKEGMYS